MPGAGGSPGSGSGGEVYEVELLKGLHTAGDDLHILLSRGKPRPAELEDRIEEIWPRRGLRWPLMWTVMPRWINRCWRRHGFDLLRAHSVRFLGPPCLWARRRWKLPVPVVTHLHHLDPSPLNRLIERRVLMASDLVVADSLAAATQLHDLVGHGRNWELSRKVRVINPGVSEAYVPNPQAQKPRDERFLMVAMGPLIPRKEPGFLLRVMAELKRTGHTEALLFWIGDGPLRRAVETSTFGAGLGPMVRWLGHVPEAQKIHLLQSAKLFLHASTLEGFALSPLEAMGCGVPVVARRATSMPEMVPADCGTLVGDAAEFADAIRSYMGHEQVRAEHGRNAADLIHRRFRWTQTVESVRKAYEAARRGHAA